MKQLVQAANASALVKSGILLIRFNFKSVRDEKNNGWDLQLRNLASDLENPWQCDATF